MLLKHKSFLDYTDNTRNEKIVQCKRNQPTFFKVVFKGLARPRSNQLLDNKKKKFLSIRSECSDWNLKQVSHTFVLIYLFVLLELLVKLEFQYISQVIG